jgi:hypothetical protein
MPVTVKVSVTDNRSSGGKRFPVSNEELFLAYGTPWDLGFVGAVDTLCNYIGKEAEITFEAQDSTQQEILDEWANVIASDDVRTIRKKCDAAVAAANKAAAEKSSEQSGDLLTSVDSIE